MKLLRVIGLLALCALSATAFAQYPTHPVKIIVPFAVGGTGDIVARVVAQKLTERTGKTFLVENKTGAGGRIGYEAAAKSPGDGYTLAATDATYTMLPGLYGNLNWDQANDLVPVTISAQAPFVVAVSPQAQWKTLKELLDFAKANPGKINYGSAGIGSVNHVVTEMFMREANVTMTHVPYKGMGDALTGLLTGSVDLLITAMPTVIGQVKSGKIVPLAVTSGKRSSAMPNVPSVQESGVPFVASNWFGLTAPKGTPKPAIDYLYQEVVKALDTSEVRELFAAQGAEPSGITPEDFGRLLREDTKRWGDVIRSAKIKAE
jgi:tripartite-type tricarboxylate transporter receptor subunit TctC